MDIMSFVNVDTSNLLNKCAVFTEESCKAREMTIELSELFGRDNQVLVNTASDALLGLLPPKRRYRRENVAHDSLSIALHHLGYPR